MGNAPPHFVSELQREAARLRKALKAFVTVPVKAEGWTYAQVKEVADNINWEDRHKAHQGITLLTLFCAALRVGEATHLLASDIEDWTDPSNNRRMVLLRIKDMKNMDKGEVHTRVIPWEFLKYGERIQFYLERHKLPQGSYLLRAPPSGSVDWAAKPNCPYTNASHCVKKLLGNSHKTHGGRRGQAQEWANQDAPPHVLKDATGWRSDDSLREYVSTTAATFVNLYDKVAAAHAKGSLASAIPNQVRSSRTVVAGSPNTPLVAVSDASIVPTMTGLVTQHRHGFEISSEKFYPAWLGGESTAVYPTDASRKHRKPVTGTHYLMYNQKWLFLAQGGSEGILALSATVPQELPDLIPCSFTRLR